MRLLVVASVLWPVVLAGSTWTRAHGRALVPTTLVYLAASRVCHQRPERSFHWQQAQWPVCGRCLGLYLAAPVGAVAAAAMRRRIRGRRAFWLLAAASVPTALTLVLEWLDLVPVMTWHRFVFALPLGAAIAGVIVMASRGTRDSIR